MDMEDDWKQYPVIRLDMSRGGASADEIRSYLNHAGCRTRPYRATSLRHENPGRCPGLGASALSGRVELTYEN